MRLVHHHLWCLRMRQSCWRWRAAPALDPRPSPWGWCCGSCWRCRCRGTTGTVPRCGGEAAHLPPSAADVIRTCSSAVGNLWGQGTAGRPLAADRDSAAARRAAKGAAAGSRALPRRRPSRRRKLRCLLPADEARKPPAATLLHPTPPLRLHFHRPRATTVCTLPAGTAGSRTSMRGLTPASWLRSWSSCTARCPPEGHARNKLQHYELQYCSEPSFLGDTITRMRARGEDERCKAIEGQTGRSEQWHDSRITMNKKRKTICAAEEFCNTSNVAREQHCREACEGCGVRVRSGGGN